MAVTSPRTGQVSFTNVYVKSDSPAGERYRTQRNVAAVTEELEAIAPAFKPDAKRDLHDFGGKKIPQLVFTSFYLGGEARWAAGDVTSIDSALEKAMSDPGLEDVIAQYFPGEQLSSTFAGHQFLADAPDTVYKDTVENLLADLYQQGKLTGDLGSTVHCFLLPPGVVLVDGTSTGGGQDAANELQTRAQATTETPTIEEEDADSLHGLGGYHGSIHPPAADGGTATLYYAVGVYSETTDSGDNGIVAFDEPWKNVVATFYHELQEARTDADVEDAIRASSMDEAVKFLGWMSLHDGEIGDIPMEEAGPNLGLVMKEVPLADGSGTVPIQLMWSNRVHGPEGPS